MNTYDQINKLIEQYASAVRNKDAVAVSDLFADQFDHLVHGLNSDPESPWNNKKETDRNGIKKAYEAFFNNTNKLEISYTNRIIDTNSKAAALVVRVEGPGTNMANALHIKWNDNDEIIYFHNWYGMG